MKKNYSGFFKKTGLTLVMLAFASMFVKAQQEPCGTTKLMDKLYQEHPEYKLDQDNLENQLRQIAEEAQHSRMAGTPYTIPCVVHIIHTGQALGAPSAALSGSIPNPTDAQIRAAFDAVNADYNKRNNAPRYAGNDSTGIKLCLATKDPSGVAMPAGAINRFNGALAATWTAVGLPASNATTYNASGIMRSSAGIPEADLSTLVKWPINKYYNIYIVTEIDGNNGGSGIQGFAYFPPGGMTSPDRAIMIPSSFSPSDVTTFDHEMGHALSLYHTFRGAGGAEDPNGTGACPTEASCSTDGDMVCDIPLHKSMLTTACKADNTANACQAGSTYGQFQYNYMNYGACPNGFSPNQTTRMRGTLSSNAIRINQVSPANLTACGCDGTNPPYADFVAATVNPCIGVGVQFTDMTSYAPTSWLWSFSPTSISYTGGTSATSKNPIVIFNAAGPYTVTLTATNTYGSNTNTKTAYISPVTGASLPFIEGFESATFPPTGWTRTGDDIANGTPWDTTGVKQWERRATSGNGTSTASAAMNHFAYGYNTDSRDNLISKPVSLSGATSPILTFKVAHKNYPNPANSDTLTVYISSDCGNTFVPSGYKKSGAALATSGSSGSTFSPTVAANWRTETINLSSYIGSNVIVKFETKNEYGNNIFLDDINISDAVVAGVSILQTTGTNPMCAGSSATFTATPTNGGTAPSYQWKVNGISVGTNSSTYTTSTLTNGQVVTCVMTSNLPGVTGNPATSNAITMTVNALPNAGAGVDKVLTCSTPSVVLNGSSSTAGATFNWAGTGIVSGGTTATPTVNANGTYTITVTNPTTGCTATDMAVVTSNTTAPNAAAGADKVLTCTATSVVLNGSSSTAGATFSWAGTGIVSGGTTATPTVNTNGTYTITVTNPTNGCTATDMAVVTSNTTAPNANAGIDKTLTCTATSVVLSGSSSTAGASFNWAGAGIVSGGTTATPTVNANGTYTITVTDPTNGCTATDMTIITSNTTAPNAAAGADKVLTCSTPSVVLNGSSSTAGATFNWTGAGIVSGGTTATPTVNANGTYTITVTDPANGCTATDMAVITSNITAPNAAAGADKVLTCTATSVVLNGSSSTLGVTFSWTGAGIVSGGTTATPTVNANGTYTITVTNPANGCTATDMAVVTSNTTAPNANAGIDKTLTCTATSVVLNGSSSTAGATFNWTGAGIVSGGTTATPTVNANGTYTITVTNPANGCTATDMAVITSNTTAPNANAGADKTLTCAVTAVTLSGSSSTVGVTFNWTGAGIVSGGTTATPTVNANGTYTITVTDPANGCTATDMAVITSNTTPPNANAGADQTLTCTPPTVTLNGSSSTAGVTYNWSGAGIVSGGTTATPTVNAAGTYTITVTNPVNGCTATDLAVVNPSVGAPNASAGADKVLTCATTSVVLNGSSSTSGVTYSWSGAGIVSGGTTATPTVNANGTYTITVTNPGNGCTSTDMAVVTSNTTAPNAAAGADKVLTCTATSVVLNGSSSTSGVTFSWTGAGIVSGGTTATPTVNANGTYTITVTNPANGCTATDMAVITSNTTAPNAAAGADKVLTCTATSVVLNGSSSTGGATFNWTGAGIVSGGTTATPTVNANGTYTITVTNPTNGCTATDMAVITSNTTAPNAAAGADKVLTCTATSAVLNGSSSTSGVTFNWTGAGIVSGGTTATPTVNANGTYTITVTNPVNGCTATDMALVTSNTTAPNAAAGADKVLTCTATSVVLNGSSSTGGATFNWTGAGIVSGGTTATPTVNANGTYTITVTNPANGCTATDMAVITSNTTAPNAAAGADKVLTCTATSVVLNGSSSTTGATFNWTGAGIVSGGTSATPTVNANGTYTLTVTNPANGCTKTDVAVITTNTTPPNANAGADQTLTCAVSTVILDGSLSSSGMNYSWSGPAFTASTQTASTSNAGTYTLTVTDPLNGCTASDQVIVSPSAGAPNVNAGADQTLTCSVTSAILNGSSSTPGVTYNWAGAGIVSGATNQTPTINAAGTYTLTVTDPGNGCSSSDQVVVNNNNTSPDVNAGADATFCSGSSVILNGSSITPNANFNWNGPSIVSGGATTTPTVGAAGSYTLTVTDAVNGCSANDVVLVTSSTVPPTPTITQNGSTLTSSSATGNQWYLDGVAIAGATNQTYVFTANGDYSVIVTSGACSSSSSSSTTVMNVGVESLTSDLNKLVVYPNPTDGNFILSFVAQQATSFKVEIFNSVGQVVYSQSIKDFSGTYSEQLNVVKYGMGIYTVSLTSDTSKTVKKLIVY